MPSARWSNPTVPSPEQWMTDLHNAMAADAGNMQMVVHPDHLRKKRERDEGLPAEPESEPESEPEGKKPRT
jgi:hypothetical protein